MFTAIKALIEAGGGTLDNVVTVEEATGLLATRYAPTRYQESKSE